MSKRGKVWRSWDAAITPLFSADQGALFVMEMLRTRIIDAERVIWHYRCVPLEAPESLCERVSGVPSPILLDRFIFADPKK